MVKALVSLCFTGLNKILKEHGFKAQTIKVGDLIICSSLFFSTLELISVFLKSSER